MDQIWAHLVFFFNSSFFTALVTGLTGAVAIGLYNRQKQEKKEQIATLLINDIRNSWEAIRTVKEYLKSTANTPEISILSENNWKKYSYLFSRDLDQDEMDITNKYFSNIERIGYIVTQSNDTFITQIKDRDAALQNTNLAMIANSKNEKDATKKIQVLDKIFASGISTSPYYPRGFIDKLNNYLPEVIDLINTPVGTKLKKIAKI